MTPREAVCALCGVDVLVRAVIATALQLGIAGGVGLMLVMQSKVAERDDRESACRPRSAEQTFAGSR